MIKKVITPLLFLVMFLYLGIPMLFNKGEGSYQVKDDDIRIKTESERIKSEELNDRSMILINEKINILEKVDYDYALLDAESKQIIDELDEEREMIYEQLEDLGVTIIRRGK